MKNTLLYIFSLTLICTSIYAKKISDVMPLGGTGFDPWNTARWNSWYDAEENLIEPFEIDISITFADKTSSWNLNSSFVRRILGGIPSAFIITRNSDIEIDGNGIIIDARTAVDLTYDLYHYYVNQINLDNYSMENCFLIDQNEYSANSQTATTIHNMTIKGFSRGIAFHHEHRRNVIIDNVLFQRDIWGIFPRGQNGTIQNCQFYENVMGGFYCEYNSYDWKIQNNTFKDNNTRGVKSYGDIVVDACRDYLITGNTFLPSTYNTRNYHTAISIYRNKGENLDIRELAPRDNIITNNTFDKFNIGIDFAPRQANASINDSSQETRCYTMDNTVTNNEFNNCKIGIVLRSNYTQITGNSFSNTERDIALLNMFYSVHHNTIDQPENNLWLWATQDDYTDYAAYLGYINQFGSQIPKTDKFFHMICPNQPPTIYNSTNNNLLIADSLAVPDISDVDSNLITNQSDLTDIAKDWLKTGTSQPFTNQSTELSDQSPVDLKDYSVLANYWNRHSVKNDFYSINFKQPIDVASGDMAVFEEGDEFAIIWDKPVSNLAGTDYYTIGIFDQKGNELDRCGKSDRKWKKITAGNFLPDGGWIPQNDNYEIAAISQEADENGKRPVYIFHKGFMEPTVTLLPDNTEEIIAITAGNFDSNSDEYQEIAIKLKNSSEIICFKPSDTLWSNTITNTASNIIEMASGEFSGRTTQDEIAAVTDTAGAIYIYKIGTDGTYKTCADYGKKWESIAAANFDTITTKDNIVLSESPVDADSTLGYWSFEEKTGQYTYSADYTIAQIALRRGSSDSAWQDPAWTAKGKRGNCLSFNGEQGSGDGDIDILRPQSATDVSLFNTSDFTIEAWIKLDEIPTSNFDFYNPYTILSFGGKDTANSNKDSYFLRITKRTDDSAMLNAYYYAQDGTAKSFSHSAHLVTNKWYHVAYSHNSNSTTNNISIWVDGTEETTSSNLHPRTDLTITGESLCVGAMWQRQRCFNGLIDEVRVSNKKLETSELLINAQPQTLYYFTDSGNTPIRELQLPFTTASKINITSGKLAGDMQIQMYQTTKGLTEEEFYNSYQSWLNSVIVLPNQTEKYSAPIYQIGVNPQDLTQSAYRLIPIMR